MARLSRLSALFAIAFLLLGKQCFSTHKVTKFLKSVEINEFVMVPEKFEIKLVSFISGVQCKNVSKRSLSNNIKCHVNGRFFRYVLSIFRTYPVPHFVLLGVFFKIMCSIIYQSTVLETLLKWDFDLEIGFPTMEIFPIHLLK